MYKSVSVQKQSRGCQGLLELELVLELKLELATLRTWVDHITASSLESSITVKRTMHW